MNIDEMLSPESVLCNAQARSKKHSLEILSELLVKQNPEIAADDVFEKLIERERLGCTSLDLGVAFPHCRVNGIHASVAALIKLSTAVDFDSPDGEPVDLIFGLMVPQDIDASHYEEIREIADMLRDHNWRRSSEEATSSKDLYDIIMDARDSAEETLDPTESEQV